MAHDETTTFEGNMTQQEFISLMVTSILQQFNQMHPDTVISVASSVWLSAVGQLLNGAEAHDTHEDHLTCTPVVPGLKVEVRRLQGLCELLLEAKDKEARGHLMMLHADDYKDAEGNRTAKGSH